MDQATFEGLMHDYQTECSAENTIYDMEAFAGKVGSPIVLLVHGIGGNARHWSDPIGLNVNDTWLFDLNAPPPKDDKGLASSPPYNASAVNSWTQFLRANNISYINFSQVKPGDLLEYAVAEVIALLTSLEKKVYPVLEQDAASGGGPISPLIILCHSRGGLVTRAALKSLGNTGVPHLKKVITLCTPHHGSYMPKLADDYNNGLHNQVNFNILGDHLPAPIQTLMDKQIEPILNGLANKVREAMLHSFGSLAQSAGFDELIPDSPTLQRLAQEEQPLAGVQYYGFGGSNPTFVDFFLCVAGQAIHLLGTASTRLVDILGSSIPGIHANYGGLTELSQGDSAVGLVSSHWPDQFAAAHQDFHLNHMQALIDKPLQNAVLVVINENTASSW